MAPSVVGRDGIVDRCAPCQSSMCVGSAGDGKSIIIGRYLSAGAVIECIASGGSMAAWPGDRVGASSHVGCDAGRGLGDRCGTGCGTHRAGPSFVVAHNGVVGLGGIQVAKAVVGHIGQINPVAGSDRLARVVVEEIGLGSARTTPTDANGFNSRSRLNTWSHWNWIFDDWSRITGNWAGIKRIWGLEYATGVGQRYGENGDEPFHDLSPLIVNILTQMGEVNWV